MAHSPTDPRSLSPAAPAALPARKARRSALMALKSAAAAVVEPLEDRRLLSVSPTLISVNFSGTGGANGSSDESSVTSDGRFIAFSSFATDLVPNDTNPVEAIYLRDTQAGTTTLISAGAANAPANGNSFSPKVSADGRFVVFASNASNLVGNDTNGVADIFIRDTQTGTTTRVSVTPGGTNASGFSGEPVISADGMYVAFSSFADNLVLSPSVSNSHDNVYLWNRVTGQTKLVSVNAAGTSASNGSSFDPSISAGGNEVTFRSNSTDLESSVPVSGGTFNVFLRNLVSNTTSLVSVNENGNAAGNKDSTSASVSNTGQFVVFRSGASDLVSTPSDQNNNDDVFLRDTSTSKTTLLSADFLRTGSAHGFSEFPTISTDGHFAAFSSTAPDLIPNDSVATEQVFVRDLQAGPIYLVSANSAGTAGNGPSFHTFLSPNGEFVTFTSGATDLAATPNSGKNQIYLASVPAVTMQPGPTPTPTPTPGPTPTPTPTGPDTTPPTAAVLATQTPPTTGSPTYNFEVQLADNVALNTVNLGNLTVTTPSGATVSASVAPTVTGTPGIPPSIVGSGPGAFVLYQFTAADASLGASDNGTYTVAAPPGAIKDAAGNDLTKATGAAVNIGSFSLNVAPAASADLVGTLGGKLPISVLDGKSGSVTLTITNQGVNPVTKATVPVAVYLSELPNLLPGSTPIATVNAKLSLKHGQHKGVKVNFKYPLATPNGNYYVLTQIDPANAVPEINKVNNVAATAKTITVSPAFVGLSAVSVVPTASTLTPGRATTLLLTVQNKGNTTASGTLPINFTAAVNNQDSTGTGAPLGTAVVKIKIKPGATSRLKVKFTPSASAPAGSTFLTATIDPANFFKNPTPGGNIVTTNSPVTVA